MTDWADRRAAWNARYHDDEYKWGHEPNDFVVRHAGALPPGRALDLGCGRGGNAIWLAKRRHEVTGVDWSEEAIAQATAAARGAGVAPDFIVADIVKWSTRERFDLVVLSYIQLPEIERIAVHDTAYRALAPGGTLLLVAHHHDNLEHGLGGPQVPDVLYTEEQLASDFAGLVIDMNDKVMRHVERDGRVGDAIDIAFVARNIDTT